MASFFVDSVPGMAVKGEQRRRLAEIEYDPDAPQTCTGCWRDLTMSAFRRRPDPPNRPTFTRCRMCEKRSKIERRTGKPAGELIGGTQCEACGETDESKLCLDHSHVSGRIRGVLCRRCNLTLGWATDDAKRLRALAAYLDGKLI